MTDVQFVVSTSIFLAGFLAWGFKYLPGERWQMLAVVPSRKKDGEEWQGTNLTYYGFFIATSQLLAISLLLLLLGSLDISLAGILLAVFLLLSICLPAARIMAILVEKKHHTFTVGGASFVGVVVAPFCILGAEKGVSIFAECHLPVLPVLAAMAIAYTLGEGLGRLACISYGCCYGKPLKECSLITRKIFARTGFIFYGPTRKVEYESKLGGERLVPVQAITSILYALTAQFGCWLFLHGSYTMALVFCMTTTQVWRMLSECLRADFRGFGKISAYQKMGLVSVIYTAMLSFFFKQSLVAQPIISNGLHSLWQPGVIVGLQVLWLIFFVYFGRSTITSSTVSYSLVQERT